MDVNDFIEQCAKEGIYEGRRYAKMRNKPRERLKSSPQNAGNRGGCTSRRMHR